MGYLVLIVGMIAFTLVTVYSLGATKPIHDTLREKSLATVAMIGPPERVTFRIPEDYFIDNHTVEIKKPDRYDVPKSTIWYHNDLGCGLLEETSYMTAFWTREINGTLYGSNIKPHVSDGWHYVGEL